jgi:hypothetical protein
MECVAAIGLVCRSARCFCLLQHASPLINFGRRRHRHAVDRDLFQKKEYQLDEEEKRPPRSTVRYPLWHSSLIVAFSARDIVLGVAKQRDIDNVVSTCGPCRVVIKTILTFGRFNGH